ncbi:serine/threonine-protein kinase [Streptomyces sp. NPDC048603]|uniref:serine/threonine-protein kinase n=1 Tax=Streptomyces sp. NPDC048603 TaxID=3365577 RepID=UPI003711D641
MSSIGSGGRVLPARPGDPKKIGPYRVIGRLGSGGMGTVHAALDPQGVRVAVKVIHSAQAQDPEFRARFRREVQLSARVSGPCLIPLLAADPEAEGPWLATGYAPGPTLNQHLSAHGILTDGSLYALATGTAQAMAAIHHAGVVHRDVKPQNVILSPAGPRVLDFGIAHAADGTSVTRTGLVTGTPGWISPEQYRTGMAGPAGDVFAWGALIAYASTGRLPFGTGAPDVVAFRVMSGEADLDGIPDDLRDIVERALAKEPEDRPTAEEAAELCALLLSAQATQVIAPDATPTLVGDLVAAEWDMPTLDDPTWHAPPVSGRGKGLFLTVGIAAALAGGLTGGLLALPSEGRNDHHSSNNTTQGSTSNSAGTVAPPATGAPPASTGRNQNSGGTTTGEDGPTIATWKQARGPQSPAENDGRPSLGNGILLEPTDYPDQEYKLTFHEPREEIYVAASGGRDLNTAMVQELAKTICMSFKHLSESYKGMPYSTYVIVDTGSKDSPRIAWVDNFRTNSSCSTSASDRTTNPKEGQAADWYPDAGGLAGAQKPSSDPDLIRTAGSIATTVMNEWNGNISGDDDHNRLTHSNMSIGFDPESRVMYVWATKPKWDKATRDDWGHEAAQQSCQMLTAEAKKWANFPYNNYAVLVDDPVDGSDWMRWGSIGDCTKA